MQAYQSWTSKIRCHDFTKERVRSQMGQVQNINFLNYFSFIDFLRMLNAGLISELSCTATLFMLKLLI